jgi:uncharacterized membrane protein YtjA (UPF0391 family)
MRALALVLCLTLLSGCNSFKLRNLGKSGASAGVAYVINPIAGVATLATAMAYDEIIPDQPSVEQIETKEQATAYIAESLFMNGLYAFIAFLLISLIIAPWIASKRGYNTAKKKYSVRLNKEVVDQIKDTIKNE